MADNPIWKRLPSDTDKSFEAFVLYRDMGANRSLEKVSQELAKSVQLLKRWSVDHNWKERTRLYDDYGADLRLERLQKARVGIEDNVLSDYDVLRKAVDKRIKLLVDNEFRATAEELHSLLALVHRLDDYARRAVGLPDKITESKNDTTVKGSLSLTWEEAVKQARNELDENE